MSIVKLNNGSRGELKVKHTTQTEGESFSIYFFLACLLFFCFQKMAVKMYFVYFHTFLNCIKFKLKSRANSYRVRDLKNEAYIPAEKLKNRKSFTHKYIENESI